MENKDDNFMLLGFYITTIIVIYIFVEYFK